MGADNVFFTGVASGVGQLYRLPGAARATINGSATVISTVLGTAPISAFPDSAGDIWVASGSNFITEVTLTAGGTTNGYNSNNFTVASPAKGIVVGPTNTVYALSGDPADTNYRLHALGHDLRSENRLPCCGEPGRHDQSHQHLP